MRAQNWLVSAIAVVGVGCGAPPEPTSDIGAAGTANVDAPTPTIGLIDDARINDADSEPGNWLAHGRTYEEQRFSPLTGIDRDNVAQLGLA